MSVDELGRAAARAARGGTATLDPELMLRRLHRQRRGQRIASIAVAAAVFAVVAAGLVELGRPAETPPASRPTPTVSASTDSPCNNVTIFCVGANQFRISLTVPATVTLPDNFADISRLSDSTFEAYRSDVDTAGVAVLENAVPVRNDASWSRDPAAGTTASEMANWLVRRPFLTGAKLTATTVDGRSAWRVSAALKPGAPLRAAKLREGQVAPTFTDVHTTAAGSATMGYNPTLLGDYTLLDIPGAGVTVLWSWALDLPRTQLTDNQALIDALRW